MFSLKNIIIVVVVLGVGALVWIQQNTPIVPMTEPATTAEQKTEPAPKAATKPSPSSPQAAATSSKITEAPMPANLYGAEAEALVMNQVEAYNNMDLFALLNTYHVDVEHIQLSSEGSFQGKDVSWKVFGDLFRKNDWLKAEVLQKMVVGDVVILIEKLTSSSEKGSILAMVAYQLQEGLIRKVWYYYGLPEVTIPELSGVPAVNAQLLAYNNQDLSGFMDPYAQDAKLLTLGINGDRDALSGYDEIYPVFENIFKTVEGLNAQILARIIQNPMVVDHEYVTAKGRDKAGQAIAIYIVDKNLIKQVWFIYPRFK